MNAKNNRKSRRMVMSDRLSEPRKVLEAAANSRLYEQRIPAQLANTLLGVSQAITQIAAVSATHRQEARSLSHKFGPARPELWGRNVLRYYQYPTTEIGRMLAVQPDTGLGAGIGVYTVSPTTTDLQYRVYVPNNHQIFDLLATPEDKWCDIAPHAGDLTRGVPEMHHPFHAGLRTSETSYAYSAVFIQLVDELLVRNIEQFKSYRMRMLT